MLGFFFFVMIVVVGALGLIAGLRMLGVVGTETPRLEGGVPTKELERIQDAILTLERRFEELQEQQQFLERLLDARSAGGALPPHREDDGASTGDPEDSILFDTREEER